MLTSRVHLSSLKCSEKLLPYVRHTKSRRSSECLTNGSHATSANLIPSFWIPSASHFSVCETVFSYQKRHLWPKVDKWYLPVSAIWSEFHTLPSTHRHPQRTSVHNNAMLMLAFEMPSNGHRSTLLQCLPDKAHQTTGFSPPLTTAEDFTTLHKPWS